MLRVFNTLTKNKEPFETVKPGKVGMYLCGPTVYKPSHIGHMVGPVIFDAIKRYLVYSGYQVTWVVNITDVDDKLINESNARGMPMAKLAEEMTADYMHNIEAMGVDSIDHFPRCTATMPEIIQFTQDLIDKGFAYEAKGDVYFDVTKDKDYGKLSHRELEAMQGEGGGMAERKRNSADFALWKSAKPGEPSWDSPWGPGRPGWHIECSAMSKTLLGRNVRHPRRRAGPRLPASRKRNRPERMLPRQADGEILDAQRADAGLGRGRQGRRTQHQADGRRSGRPGGGQDQQIERLGPVQRAAEKIPARGDTVLPPFDALSPAIDYSETRIKEVETGMETFYRFFKRFERIVGESFYALEAPKTRKAGDFEPGENPLLAGRRRRAEPISWKRWTTISTPAAASPRCSISSGCLTNSPTTRNSKTRPNAMPAKLHTLTARHAGFEGNRQCLGPLPQAGRRKSGGG